MRGAIDDYVNSLIEAKREGMYATLAPLTAMIENLYKVARPSRLGRARWCAGSLAKRGGPLVKRLAPSG